MNIVDRSMHEQTMISQDYGLSLMGGIAKGSALDDGLNP